MGKSFKSARDEQKEAPIDFDLEGEEFNIPRPLPGFILLDFAAAAGAEGSEAVVAYAKFFTEAFGNDDEYKRFRKACSKLRVPLKKDLDGSDMAEDEVSLLSIAQYIIGEASGHPTEQRSDSPELALTSGTDSDTAA